MNKEIIDDNRSCQFYLAQLFSVAPSPFISFDGLAPIPAGSFPPCRSSPDLTVSPSPPEQGVCNAPSCLNTSPRQLFYFILFRVAAFNRFIYLFPFIPGSPIRI